VIRSVTSPPLRALCVYVRAVFLWHRWKKKREVRRNDVKVLQKKSIPNCRTDLKGFKSALLPFRAFKRRGIRAVWEAV
jgi:hypothetical protein